MLNFKDQVTNKQIIEFTTNLKFILLRKIYFFNYFIISLFILVLFIVEFSSRYAQDYFILIRGRPLSVLSYHLGHGGWGHLFSNTLILIFVGNRYISIRGQFNYVYEYLFFSVIIGYISLSFINYAIGTSGTIKALQTFLSLHILINIGWRNRLKGIDIIFPTELILSTIRDFIYIYYEIQGIAYSVHFIGIIFALAVFLLINNKREIK